MRGDSHSLGPQLANLIAASLSMLSGLLRRHSGAADRLTRRSHQREALEPHLHVGRIDAERRRHSGEGDGRRRPEIEQRVELIVHAQRAPLVAWDGHQLAVSHRKAGGRGRIVDGEVRRPERRPAQDGQARSRPRRDVGLQPRQVAIWFQNRRARWKTKQLEKDYDVLKRQYEGMGYFFGCTGPWPPYNFC